MLANPSHGPRVMPASNTQAVWRVTGTGVPETGIRTWAERPVNRAKATTASVRTNTGCDRTPVTAPPIPLLCIVVFMGADDTHAAGTVNPAGDSPTVTSGPPGGWLFRT